jgi:predicted dehydrogenase
MINILIVGTGKIASRFMLGINNIEGLNVAFIFSRDILNAKKFSEVWSIKNYTDNFNNISDEIDIAYISTPTNTHYDIASILIRKKINVLVEKPIVTNSTHLRRLISLAKLYKVNIIDGMWTLYNPIVRNASFLTGNSTPLFIESYLCFDNQHNSNVLTDSKNGGAVKDILTYQLYLVALFCNSKKLEIINRQKFFNNNNVDYKYKLKIQSGRILAKLYGNIATRNGSRFVVHYKDFDLVIFYPIYNPKLLLFLPRNYYNIRVILK